MDTEIEIKPENIYIKEISNKYEVHLEGTNFDICFYLKKEGLMNIQNKINEILKIKNG